MPKISVIIPVYKVENYITQCLNSIANQTFLDFEVLLIDDVGKDNSLKIMIEFSLRDKRFRVIQHEQNKGIATARNTGYANAQGEIIIYIDPDDWIQQNAFQKIVDVFDSYPNVQSVVFDYFVYIENDKLLQKSYAINSEFGQNKIFLMTPDIICRQCACIWNKAFRKKSIEAIGLRFTDGKLFEDDEYTYKYYLSNKNTYYINDFLYNYRIRENSFMRQGGLGLIRCEDMFDMFMRIYNYTNERGLLADYKGALLYILYKLIKNQKMNAIHDKIVDNAYEILKKINFPSDFEDCYI